jgi:uncharacterized membrane protein
MSHIATKTFMDGQGRIVRAGTPLPSDYDKPTLAHYTRLGMAAAAPQKNKPGPRPIAPVVTKPAAPEETKAPEATTTATDTGAGADVAE